MRRLLKTVFPLALLVLLLTGLSLNAFALTTVVTTHIIDNDDAQGYSNARFGFDTWFQASTLYYQDARKQVCYSEDSGYEYCYYFPDYTSNGYIHAQVSAYLYNINFTDPSATYEINSSSSIDYFVAGCINQDLAAPGWNVVGEAIAKVASGGLYYTNTLGVRPSLTNPTKYCGADAIKIELGY